MKRLIVLLAVLVPMAALATYVAIAPVSLRPGVGALGTLDGLAARFIALAGRNAAVIALMALGVVLAVIAAQRTGRNGASDRKTDDHFDDGPGPLWSPEPLGEERLAGLRRRRFLAFQDPEPEDPDTAAPPSGTVLDAPDAPSGSSLPSPPPVLLLRKARERERDWFGDGSWLGGLPRLGDEAWPRDPDGVPLPFAAQIARADLAAALPPQLYPQILPEEGALAFFLGTGAVVAVRGQPEDFSDPPHDLPPAFDEGGASFPPQVTRLSRHFFPFWPVEPLALTVPHDLDARSGAEQEAALRRALAARLPALGSVRPHPLRADHGGAVADGAERERASLPALYWHAAALLADQLDAAHAASAAPLAQRRALLHARQQAASRMLSDPQTGLAEMDAAEAEILALEDETAVLEGQRPALAQMVQALDGFVAGRDPWERLSEPEQALLGEILAEVNANYAEIVRGHAAATLVDLATASLRAMVSGPPDALAALPDTALSRINREHRLPPRWLHRMFGPASAAMSADERASAPNSSRAEDTLLLLQLGPDELMEWRWDEGQVFRFRIARADAARGNWAAAVLSFEEA